MKGVLIICIVSSLLFASTQADLPGVVLPSNMPASVSKMTDSVTSNPAVSITKSTMDSTTAFSSFIVDWINLFFSISQLDNFGFYIDKKSAEGMAIQSSIAAALSSIAGMSVMMANPVGAFVSYVTPMMQQGCSLFDGLEGIDFK